MATLGAFLLSAASERLCWFPLVLVLTCWHAAGLVFPIEFGQFLLPRQEVAKHIASGMSFSSGLVLLCLFVRQLLAVCFVSVSVCEIVVPICLPHLTEKSSMHGANSSLELFSKVCICFE